MAGRATKTFVGLLVAPSPAATVRAIAGIATGAGMLLALAVPAASSLADRRGGSAAQLAFVSSQAYALAIQADGKVVVVGAGGTVGKRDFALARYRRNGRLDSSFGRGGKLLTGFGSDGTAWDVAIQPDGKIVVAGSSSRGFELARYRRGGSLDASFERGGKVSTSLGRYSGAARVVIRPDRKLVVVGWSGRPAHLVLVRYTRTGSLDRSFGRGGQVMTSLGVYVDWPAWGAAIQPDGKILVSFANGSGIARFSPDGTLDATFGRRGTVTTERGTALDGLAIQGDGKVVAGGGKVSGSIYHDGDFALSRYLANGRPDSTFGSSATIVTDFTPAGACCEAQGDDARAVAIETDGTLVAVGASGTEDASDHSVAHGHFALVRYTADGSLDLSFGRGGKVLTGFGSDSGAWDAAIQPDGKIVAAGYGSSSAKRFVFALARYRSDGSLDAGFGNGGKVTTDFGLR